MNNRSINYPNRIACAEAEARLEAAGVKTVSFYSAETGGWGLEIQPPAVVNGTFVKISEKVWLNIPQIVAVWFDDERWNCSTCESEKVGNSYKVAPEYLAEFLQRLNLNEHPDAL